MKDFTVYKLTSPSKKVYIGLTCRTLKQRWNNGKGYVDNIHFTNAINKYGWNNINKEVIKTGLTRVEACELEIKKIAEYNSYNDQYGYNKTIGGDNISPETMVKMVQAKIDSGYYRLSWNKAKTIRELYKNTDKTCATIADEFGVDTETVRSVVQNQTWIDDNYINTTPRKDEVLTQSEVDEIRERYNSTYITQQELADEYGASRCYVSELINNVERPDANYKRSRYNAMQNAKNTKLDWTKVKEIRHLYQTTELTQLEISKMYNVGDSTIGSVVTNKSWIDECYVCER